MRTFSTPRIKEISTIVLLNLLLITSLASQSTWHVNASASGSNNGFNWANAFTDLQDALTVAQDGDQIWVAAGVYKPTDVVSDRDASFSISGGISLYGGFPTTGNPGFSDRDWEVHATVLSGDIDNNDPVDADGITPDGDSIAGANSYTIIQLEEILEDVIIDGFFITGGHSNTTSFAANIQSTGGAIFALNNSGLVSISNVEIIGNMSYNGGAILFSNSNLDLENVQFLNNVSTNTGGSNGGSGIRMVEGSEVSILNSSFQNNRSSRWGGAILSLQSKLTIVGCNFLDNFGNQLGGAIYAQGDTLSIMGSTFADNRNNLTANGESGGAVYVTGTVTEIVNSEFHDNGSRGAGGALRVDGANASLELSNSEFNSNYVPGGTAGGGGLFISSNVPVVQITGTSFVENSTTGSFGGGAIFKQGSNEWLIEDCIFESNFAGGFGNGGSIFNQSPLTILNSTFTADSTTGSGGSLDQNSQARLTIIGSSFSNCSASSSGGAIIHRAAGDTIIIQNTVFSGNSAFSGGALYFQGTGAQVRQITDSEFTDNSADRAGAIFHTGSSGLYQNISINNLYSGNTAIGTSRSGGAIEYFISPQSSIYDECQFIGNSVVSGTSDGGAIYGSGLIVTNSTFSENTSGRNGGALSIATSEVLNSSFIANAAGNDGGGIYHRNIANNFLIVDGSTFSGNQAGSDGGGLHILSPEGLVANSMFTDNNANVGGGIRIAGDVTLINCKISGNSATATGGGISNWSTGTVLISGCEITGNSAGINGGGYSDDWGVGNTDVSFINTTLASNTAGGDGGAIFNRSDIAKMTNSIVWGNNSGIFNSGGTASIAVDHSIVEGGITPCDNCPGGDGDIDPLFVEQISHSFAPADSGNYELRFCSPAINAGDPDTSGLNLPELDLLGNNRIKGDTIDMGAYEFQGDSILFVASNDSISGNGANWAGAYLSLQDAIEDACSCEDVRGIWVAAGTYYPDEGRNVNPGDRDATFQLCNGVELYGGFNGTETDLNQRNWEANESILSGDINQSGSLDGNSYTVVTGSNTDSTAVLDGFFIVMGNADGTGVFPNPNRRGAGMYIMDGSPMVRNSSFLENAAVWGGAMYILNSTFEGNNLIIQNNSVTSQGGGIFSEGSDLKLADFLFENNSAPNSGGGIYFNNGEMVLTNGAFIDNSTLLTGSSGGGGLFVNNSAGDVVLDDIEFIGNSSRFGGGAFFLNSEISISGSQFMNNSASWGGGFDADNTSSANVTDCTFESNSAAFGGGIRFRNSQNVVLENCLFEGNIAEFRPSTIDPGSGGGLFVVLDSEVEVINSIFVDNTAVFAGGGLTYSENSNGKINNCLIYSNHSDSLAGGFGLLQSTATILNSTIANNSALIAGGLGLATTSGATDVEVINSIVYANTASIQFENVGSEGGDISFEFSIVEGSGGSNDWDSDFGVDLGGNIGIDPQFSDPSSGNFQLTECSPALDAGTSDTTGLGLPAMDLEGNPRFFDALGDGIARVDIGAYEFQSQGTLLEVECTAALQVYLDEQGNGALDISDPDATLTISIVSSCSGGVGFTGDSLNFDCNDAGQMLSVSITATDSVSLRQDSCLLTVEVLDSIPPLTVFCPASIDTTITEEGVTEADLIIDPAEFADACGIASIENNINSNGADASDIYGQGITQVVITATDSSGNETQCVFTVTVSSLLAISCPEDEVIATDMGACSAVVSLGEATAFSPFQPVTITNDYNSGGPDASDTYPQGVTVVTFTAVDNNGDTVSCATLVTVNDMEPPSITCPQDLTLVIPEGTGPADVTLALATAMDNCATNPEISNDHNSGGADASGMYPVGTTVVTFEAEDDFGNTNSCTTSVTVEEADALTINCPTNATVDTDPGECSAVVTLALATAFSGFPPVTIENDFNDGGADASGVYDEGITTVVFTASDGNGDMVSCTTVVTVNDIEAPTLNCPSAVSANTAASSCNAFVSLVVTASDNCGIVEASNSFNTGGLNASGTYGLGETEVVFTVSDAGGLSSSCTVVVSVTDNVAPQITCPADVSVMVDPGESSVFIGNLVATATDNCTPDPEISNNQNSEGDDASGDYPVGISMVIFTAEDDFGNASNCTTNVEVIDVLPLVLNCPDDVEISVEEGLCGRNLSLMAGLEGGIEPVVVTNTKTSNGLDASAFYDVGTEAVEFTATADDGETANCSVIVTIVDDESPELACNDLMIELANAPVSIEVEDIVTSAEDNCGIESLLLSQSEFGCDDLGTHTVLVTATDEAGNEATCTAMVTVEDNTPPTAVCGEIDLVFTTVLESATPDINDLDGGSSDACGIMGLSADIPELSCADAGPVEIQLTVEDPNGNTSVCTAVVNVVCAAMEFEISGEIYHEDGSMVGGVKVDLLGFENANFETASDGEYEFTVFGGTNAVIIPSKGTMPTENVTTLDLLMIQRHILAKELLDSPYKIIASDANGDGVTSTFDLILFQTLIVGLIPELPMPSWVFVKSSYEFQDPTHPLGESFPTVRAIQGVMTDYNDQDFIGVKLGYVKYSINGGSRVMRGKPMEMLLVQSGPDVLIKTTEAIDLSGMSLSLERGASDRISESLLSEQGLSNWHIDETGTLRYIWTTGGILNAGKGEVLFRMENVQVSDIVQKENDRLPSEVVTGDKVVRPVHFVEWEQPEDGLSLEVYPNPFHQMTRIFVNGLGEETGLLEVYDVSGNLLIQRSVENGEVVRLNQLFGDMPAGVLIVRLSSSNEVKLKKVVGFK